MTWVRAMLVVAALAYGWHLTQQIARQAHTVSAADIATVAQKVKADDIVMYTTTGCAYCAQARAWFAEHKIPYRECNTQTEVECARRFQELGGNGTPLFVLRGRQLVEGFSAEDLIAALR